MAKRNEHIGSQTTEINVIFKYVAEHIDDWKLLARNLNVPKHCIQDIDSKSQETKAEKAYDVLMIWFYLCDRTRSIKDILVRAVKHESKPLAEEMCKFYNIAVPQQYNELPRSESLMEVRPDQLDNAPIQETEYVRTDVKTMIELCEKMKGESGKEYSPLRSDISSEKSHKRVKEIRKLFEQKADDNKTSKRRTSIKQNISTTNERKDVEAKVPIDGEDNAGDTPSVFEVGRSQSETTHRPNKREKEQKRRSTYPDDPRQHTNIIIHGGVQHFNYQDSTPEPNGNKNEKEYTCSRCGHKEKKKSVENEDPKSFTNKLGK